MRKLKLLKSTLCLLLGLACNMTWAQAVIFPQLQQPGSAVVEVVDGGYAIGNNLFTAKFLKTDGKITFGGSEQLGLIAGSEIFKVQLQDGTEIPASEFTLGEVVTETLTGNNGAVKGAHRFNGVQLKAQFTHTSGLAVEWRAVLRDGSHYLRTEMDIKNAGSAGINMSSITPMIYTVQNVDGEKAPVVVGNTRGAVIASDKIFAGVETPTAYNMAGESTDLESFVFKAWDGAASWAWTPEDNEIPAGIKNLEKYSAGTVNASRGYVIFREAGDCSITLDYTSGNNRLQILGVDILDVAGNVVDSDYHFGFTGGSDSNRDYTVTIPSVGAYMVRIFVTNAGNGEGYNSVGTITYSTKVSLPELVYDLASTQTPSVSPEVKEPEKLPVITPEAGTLTASQAKQTQWTSGLSQFSDWTGAIPEGMSTPTASAIYLDKHYTIESAGTLSVVFDYTSGSHGLNILGVQLISTEGMVSKDYHVGFTGGSDRNNTYSLLVPGAGNYIVRMFVDKRSDGINGNGNIDFTLTEFDNKISTSSYATDTWTSAWTGFAELSNAPEGLLAFNQNKNGTVAPTSIQYKEKTCFIEPGKLTVEFKYSGGSHGLYPIAVELLDAESKIVSKDYHPGFTGGVHKDNTYSVKVPKAGVYTVRYIVDKNSDGTSTNGNITLKLEEIVIDVLGTINEDETLADAWTPSVWKTLPASEIPNRVNEVGCTDENARVIEQQITITSAGTLSVEFLYASGSARLNMVGVDLLDATGSVVVDDYHAGFTGTEKNANVYKLNVFAPGTYTIRYFADNSENINSTGNINLKLTVDYTLHLVAPSTTPIMGKWSRLTTLKVAETWNVSSVVGIIAPGQARRSFLAYSERERAVPWRAVPAYISWYELNIDRNNAAPGSEHTNMTAEQCLPILREWKTQLYDKYGEAPYAFVWDDGWDTYGEWQFHSGFPNGFTDMDEIGRQMGAGQGAWLGPVGGYGTSGGYRRNYWSSKGGMQLSNPSYYEVFVNAVTGLLRDKGYDFRFFKFDGISDDFSALGPDKDGDPNVANENAEAIIMAEKVLRGIKEDVFLNTTVGTWASPFWFQHTDAVWRQEKDYGEIGNNSNDRENWITYRDRLVYQNFVQNSPLCPINTLMTHGFIFTNFSEPASTSRDWNAVVRELRCAFACGSGMVELYNDYTLTNELVNPATGNAGELWGEIAKCMRWQRENADVLPDIHWVGGNPWTGSKAEVYGWAAWNGKKAVLTLRNGANDAQEYTFTLREALEIPDYITSSTITFTKAFDDQLALTGLTEGEPINIDDELTVTLLGSSLYVFGGLDNSASTEVVEPPFSTELNPKYWWLKFCAGGATLSGPKPDTDALATTANKAYNNNQLWMLVGNPSGFYLKNNAGYYLSWNGSRFATTTQSADKATLLLHESTTTHAEEAGCFEIQLKGGNYMNQHGGAGVDKELGTWNPGDNNNHFIFVSAESTYPEFDNAEAWYYIQFSNGGWVIEDKGADENVRTAKVNDLNTQRWRVIGTKDNCQFVNQDNRYLVYQDNRIKTSTSADAVGFKLVTTTHASYAPCLEIQHNGTQGKSFNMHQGAGKDKEIALYDANDGGNPLSFVVASTVSFPEFSIAASSASAPTEQLTLWYKQPATAMDASDIWMEYSLPIGNGQFGASIFGGVAKEEVQFNEKTLWSGTKNDYSSEYGDYENFGSVYIEDLSGKFTYNSTKPVKDYYRDLNMKDATASVNYKDGDGVTYTRQYIASNPDKVVAMHLTASEEDKISIKVTMKAGRPGLRAETTYANGTATFGGKLETISYNALAKVVPTGGTMTTDESGITVIDADEVLIILGGATDFDPYSSSYISGTNGLTDLVSDRVDAAATKGWSSLYADHVADHKTYFDRCYFVLDGAVNNMPTDELIRQYANRTTGTEDYALMLEQLYFAYGRYLEIGSSRGIDLPSNLQGIWNNSSEPAWNADIHANINVQMNYWPAEPTNLSEMHMPFLNYIINMANSAEWKNLAQQRNGATRSEAWTMLTENNIFGGFGSFQRNALINNAWYVSHLWQHYRYTLDQAFLEKAFPAMWGATLFWIERLVLNEADGKYECPNEYSPEHGPGAENATAHSQQLVWELFNSTLKAIEILGENKVNAEDLATLRDRFSKLDTGLAIEKYTPNGNTGAWGEGAISYGSDLLREWKTSNYYAGANGHRHMSHLMCLYPFSQVTPDKAELFNAAINSMKLRGDASTGWSMGWKINLWARALDGDHSHDILELALRHHSVSGGGVYYNLYDSHSPFQIDGNFGACAGIAEMLMQSHTDVIDILPALPSVWRKGAINGLKAVGNFTVSLNWEKGKAQQVTIVSHKGAPLKVRCGHGASALADALITVDGVEVTAIVENSIATIPCTQGQTVVIDFTIAMNAFEEAKNIAKASVVANKENLGVAIGYYSYTANGKKLYTIDAVTAAIDACETEEDITAITESYKVNLPEVGKKYRFGYDFGGETGVLYLQSVNSSVKGLAMTTEEEKNSIFLVEQIDGNLRLKSVATGKYLKEDGNTRGLQTVGGNITFSAGANLGQIKIQAPSFLHANSSGDNYFVDHCGSDGGHERHNFVAVEVIDKYAFPENGKTYYIYSDTYHNGAFINRFLYADGASLKMNTALLLEDTYKWTCTVNNDGTMTFQNGAGKYLGYKVMADAAYNFTVANTRVHNPNAVTLYANANSRYIVVHNDGSQFNQSTTTYNQETEAYCTDFVFIEADNVHLLSVNGDSKVKATATWNNETKVLPASWMVFKGDKIANPTLSVTPEAAYSLLGLYSDDVNKGSTVDITALEENLELTAKYTPNFFSTTYGEKWVRLSNCSNKSYWATTESTSSEVNGKTATLDYANEKQLWCLVGTAESFVLYNKAAGNTKALKVIAETYGNGSLATLESDTEASWKLIEQDFGYAFVPTHNINTSNLGINMYGGAGGDLKLYGTGSSNTGSYWVVEMADVNKPLTLNVEVDKVWESSPRVAELTFTINGKASQTRILGDVEGQKLYLPVGATYEVSSMTYRGYTYNGCTDVDGVLTVSYTANDERTLFYTPRDGHPYRIPAIATAPNGDIFAICDYRPCNGDIGNGDVDIVCRISSDNGVTWGEELVLANGDGGSTNRMETGYGDPAIVVDRESNKILVMMVAGRTVCGNSRWDASKIGDKEASLVNRAARVYGTLNETTNKWEWTESEEVTDDIYKLFLDDSNNATVTSYFIGSGKICQSRVVKKGQYYRLYCALWTRDQGNRVIYSDDFGGSWNVLGTINDRPASNGNEPKCEELPDGTVVLSSRVAGGRYFNLFTFADDTYTTGTWGTVANSTTVRDGSSQGTNGEIYKVKAIRKEDGQICDVMLQSVPAGSGRKNVTVWYKEMDYTTDYTPATFAADWKVGKLVSDTESAYSTMILQADGRIGFFFEEAPGGYCMVYIPYTLEDLTADKYSLYTVNSTIGQYEIGTFYASEAMKIPEGVKAYAATADKLKMNGDNGYITLTEFENGIIPAKTGAILMGDAKTYNFIPSISYGTPVENNMLVGYEADNANPKSCREVSLAEGYTTYVLTDKLSDNSVVPVGFYKKETAFNVYNNRAYLTVPGGAVAVIYLDDEDDASGILETENGELKTEIYDLSGRRVQKAQKGVYIVNGKKVVVK